MYNFHLNGFLTFGHVGRHSKLEQNRSNPSLLGYYSGRPALHPSGQQSCPKLLLAILSRYLPKASAPRQLLLHCSTYLHPCRHAHAPYLRPVSNLLRQIFQTKTLGMFLVGCRPPKGCHTRMCHNKFHSHHKICEPC